MGHRLPHGSTALRLGATRQSIGRLLPTSRTLARKRKVSPQGDEGAGDYVPKRDAWQRILTKHRFLHGSAASNEPHHVAGTI
jgi:hypothetical protein